MSAVPLLGTLVLLAVALAPAPAVAETWSWAPILSGATLDAHLARCDHGRPARPPVFDLIARLARPIPRS